MTSLRTLPLCAVAAALLFSAEVLAQQPAPAVRITGPIDPQQLVTLHGTVHPLANAQNDRGPAPDSMELDRLHLVLKRSPAQEADLHQLIQEQNTPGSPNYHKWLTPAQFGARFGPSDQDLSTVENWLAGQGFTVNRIEPGRQTLDIAGTVGLLGSAFHTQIHRYMVNGQMHYANANAPQIPAALAPVIGGFASLNNFHLKSYSERLGEASYNPSTGLAKPSWTIGSGSFDYTTYNFVLSPADFAVQYNLPATLKGDGQTIAIVNESNININLVNQFRSLFGLPANPPQVIIDGNDPGVDGINNPDGPNYASVEAYLDVEWAGAVAPNATIDLVIAADTSLEAGIALAAEHAVYSDVAPVVSVSFGQCEALNGSSNAFWNNLWEQAAAQGQTVIVSTGDTGSAGCDSSNASYAGGGLAVNGLASTPYNVAVGGTDFFYSSWNSGSGNSIDTELGSYWSTTASNSTPTASIKGYIPEQPWNSSQFGLDLFNQYNLDGTTTIAAGSGGASSAALCNPNTYSSTTGLCTGTPSGYPKPSWQTGITGIPADGVRDLPDVSLFAANGYNDSYYPICATDGDCQPATAGATVQILGIGGTSASAPAFAGIMALVNQKYGRQGQANTILYPLKAQFPASFHDITHGTNSVPCDSTSVDCISVTNPASVGGVLEGQIGSNGTPDYNAGTGYDLATGLGSVDATQLINNWGSVKLATSAVTFLATPTSITHGQSVSISGTVTGPSGTPTGNVAIMTDSTEQSQQGQTSFALDGSGNYSGSLSTLPGGNYNIWASYSGDAKNGLSTSTKIPITVTPEDSGIAFGLFANSSNQYITTNPVTTFDYGTQLMLSARVAPAAKVATLQACTPAGSTTQCPSGYTTPTGTIAFKDSAATINTAVINSEGDAEFNAPFSVGSHTVSASYSGDNSYNASTAASPITFTVQKDTPQIFGATSITDQNNDLLSGAGQQTILTIIVENNAQAAANTNSTSSAKFPVPIAAPTGSVTLSGSSLSALNGTFPLSPGVDPNNGAQVGIATVVLPASTPSGTNYSVAVAYNSDNANYNSIAASSQTTFSIPIVNMNGSGLASTTTATVSGSVTPNTTLTIVGTVTGKSGHPAPTGDVYLYSSGNYPTKTALHSGSSISSTFTFTLNSQTLLQGSNQLTVQYIGDQNYNPSAYVISTAVNNPLSDFTMVAESSQVKVTAGSSTAGTATIGLGSVNGFNGPVNLSCTAAPGVNCSVSPASASLTAGGSASATLSITAPSGAANATYNVAVVGKDSTGQFIHTANVQAVVTGSAAGSSSFGLRANPDILAFPAGATAGNSTAIQVAPIGDGKYSGTVNLSCSVSPSGSGSPTCGLSASSVTLSGSYLPQSSTLTLTSNSSTAGGAYTVTVTGFDSSTNITSTTSVQVGIGDYALTKSGDITVKAGAATGNTATITVAPQGSFSGTVNLTCAISPTAASSPATCSLNPVSLALTGFGSQTATLTIATTAAATASNQRMQPFWPAAGGGAVFACVLFFWIPKKRRSWLAMFVLLAVLASMGTMACGGGGGSNSGGGGGGGTPGTTAGTYTVTVTGTAGSGSGALTHTAKVTLTVQ